MKLIPGTFQRQRYNNELYLGLLSLSASTIHEGAAENSVVGVILGNTPGSTVTLTGTAGGRFKLVSVGDVHTVEAGATATDYDVATSHDITVREVLVGAQNTPRDTVITVTVQSGLLLVSTSYVNIAGPALVSAGGSNTRTFGGYAVDQVIRITKPHVADDANLLYEAFSAWPSDHATFFPPPDPDKTWKNYFALYGNNGGADVLLFSLPWNFCATAALAWLDTDDSFPVEFSGYATYKIVGDADTNPSDNRGGLSLKVEKFSPV